MAWRMIAIAAVGLLLAAHEPEAKTSSGPGQLQGTWALVSLVERETGETTDVGEKAGYYQLKFERDAVVVHEGGTGTETCKLDTTNRQITWKDKGKVIYELVGDTLTIRQPSENWQSVLPGFTSFANYSALVYQRETPDTPHVVAIETECKRLGGTWRLIYRLPESNAKERDAEAAGTRHRLAFRSILLSRTDEEGMEYAPPRLRMVFKGRRVSIQDVGLDGSEEVDLWVNPLSAPKLMEMGAVGIEYGGTYELKGDELRVRRPGDDSSEEAVVDLWKRKK